jgi:hypothetical protein
LHHLLYGLEVIPLNFEIRGFTASLSGFNPAVSKEILDGHQVGIGIQKLGGHTVPELMAGDLQPRFPGIVLYSFLYPRN